MRVCANVLIFFTHVLVNYIFTPRLLIFLCAVRFQKYWNTRHKNNTENNEREIITDEGKSYPEKIPEPGDPGGPYKCADNIIGKKCAVPHVRDSSDYWREGANDREKTCKENCAGTVFFVEMFSA